MGLAREVYYTFPIFKEEEPWPELNSQTCHSSPCYMFYLQNYYKPNYSEPGHKPCFFLILSAVIMLTMEQLPTTQT